MNLKDSKIFWQKFSFRGEEIHVNKLSDKIDEITIEQKKFTVLQNEIFKLLKINPKASFVPGLMTA